MCGGGGGLVQAGPTPEETKNAQLSNTLLSKQIGAIAKQEADDAYKQSPAYLNTELNKTRGTQQTDFNKSKSTAYTTARNNIIDQFTAFGDPSAAQPYLDALKGKYEGLQYRSGGDYGSTTTMVNGQVDPDINNWNEEAYLAANPDVASSYGFGRTGEPAYFQSGRDHYNRVGKGEGRKISGQVAQTARTDPLAADTWDDPNVLLNDDFGASSYLTNQRKGRKDTARTTADTNIQTMLKGMGLDDETYNSLWGLADTQLDSKYDAAGLSANDYTNVFNPQAVLDSVLGTGRTAKRTQYTTKANAAFGGIDPNSDFADTADDAYINNLVGKQYGDASSALERAYKRGALTDTGFGSGMSYLGDQNKTAISSAQSLGGSVLQKNRDALGNIVTGAKTAASGWDYGQNFDVDKYLNDYTTKKGALAGSLEGDVTNALAGQNWFDIGDVLNKAGYAQGAQNTAPLTDGFTTPGLAGIASAREKEKAGQRGLGGVGVF